MKMNFVLSADALDAPVTVKIEIEKFLDGLPVVTDVLLAFFLSQVDFAPITQNELSLVPLISRWGNPAVEKSLLLLRLDTALHPRNQLLFFLGAHDGQERRKKPLIIVSQVGHIRKRDDLDIVLDEHLLDPAKILQVVWAAEPFRVGNDYRLKTLG